MGKKRCTAIVLAAGQGSRMKSDVAKQYMLLGDRPLIWYALHAVEESSVIDDCILVIGAEDISFAKEKIVAKYEFRKVKAVVAGGKERYDSVYSGLQAVAGRESVQGGENSYAPDRDGYIFIQDGARPFLTEDILKRCFAEVERTGACAAGMPVKDTIKFADQEGCVAGTPDRTRLWQIQTPQVFEAALIMEAYERLMREKETLAAAGVKITDDAGVVELMLERPVRLVEGSYRNIKVTTPEDIVVAEALMQDFRDGRLREENT